MVIIYYINILFITVQYSKTQALILKQNNIIQKNNI